MEIEVPAGKPVAVPLAVRSGEVDSAPRAAIDCVTLTVRDPDELTLDSDGTLTG